MTRINVLPVEDLCDSHLIAEWRELPRIPNKICRNKYNLERALPTAYTIQTRFNPKGGQGHESFFIYKLDYLHTRYQEIVKECSRRNLNCPDRWPYATLYLKDKSFYGSYIPTEEAVKLNTTRIIERTPKNLRYDRKPTNKVLQSLKDPI